MRNQEEHNSKLRKSKELIETLQIRKELKGELFYIYPNLFKDLFDLLSLFESDEFFFNLTMHNAARSIQDYPGDKSDMRINWWLDPNINYWILINEIFDDYWAFYLCFQHGFTKQALEILRNTYELIISLYFMKFCKKENDETINKWISGKQGLKKLNDKIDDVKKLEFLKAHNISPLLNELYDTLCMATHSHKKMMTTLTMPGVFWIRDKMMFESFIILQTRSIFLLVFDVEMKLLKHFIKQDKKSPYTENMLRTISRIEKYLGKYSTTIESIKKGYVIHKKQVALDSGKSILFSLGVNNEWYFKSRHVKSLSQEEKKDLKGKIEELLLCEST